MLLDGGATIWASATSIVRCRTSSGSGPDRCLRILDRIFCKLVVLRFGGAGEEQFGGGDLGEEEGPGQKISTNALALNLRVRWLRVRARRILMDDKFINWFCDAHGL